MESVPGKNREKKVICTMCRNKEPEKSNCNRCNGTGYIIDRS